MNHIFYIYMNGLNKSVLLLCIKLICTRNCMNGKLIESSAVIFQYKSTYAIMLSLTTGRFMSIVSVLGLMHAIRVFYHMQTGRLAVDKFVKM